jgi:hypothetical protein
MESYSAKVPKLDLNTRHGYTYATFENRVRSILEFLHKPDNLRTICQSCHKRFTSNSLGKRKLFVPYDPHYCT